MNENVMYRAKLHMTYKIIPRSLYASTSELAASTRDLVYSLLYMRLAPVLRLGLIRNIRLVYYNRHYGH